MKYTEHFPFETCFGSNAQVYDVRVTYTIDHARAQAYGQPAESARVGDDLEFEIKHFGKYRKVSDDLHDMILEVLGDDLQWLIDSAEEQMREWHEGALV
jgi:hypothetical protein